MALRVLLSAFACNPAQGSEPGNGWHWAIGLEKQGFEVHCLCRQIGKSEIEKQQLPPGLHFHYISLPLGIENLYRFSTPGMYLYYLLWQYCASTVAKKLHRKIKFDLVHHVTWGSSQLGSFMYRLKTPLIFGPAGGGQEAPEEFKEYFKQHWRTEQKRTRISKLLMRFNPAFKKNARNAKVILVSNPETKAIFENTGSKNVAFTLDAALPNDFFPPEKDFVLSQKTGLRLLWTGRFLPRKGLLLTMEVMKALRAYQDITLTVVGDGEMFEEVQHYIISNDLSSTIKLVGKVTHAEIKKFYQTHDVFVFTSLRDSCPAQLIEAMAFSLPVVTLDIHGQAVIVNSERGIKVPCTTPASTIEALKIAILQFYGDRSLVKKAGQAAFEFAKMQTWNNKISFIVQNYYPHPSNDDDQNPLG